MDSGVTSCFEFKDFPFGSSGFIISNNYFLTVLNLFIYFGIPSQNLGYIGARNPLKFKTWLVF